MERKRDFVRPGSILAKAALIILMVATGSAVAQVTPGSESEVTDSPAPRAYFHLFTDGAADEIPFDDMSAADQEGMMLMAERTDYGAEVHGAWSAVTHQAVADADAQRAAYAAGVNGLADVGVQ